MLETKYRDVCEDIRKVFSSYNNGERLPGVQVLSQKLSVAPQTVTKAIKLLQKEGKVVVLGTRGTFLTEPAAKKAKYSRMAVIGIHKEACHIEYDAMENQAIKSGYNFVSVTSNQPSSFFPSDFLLDFPADGFIFTNSTINADMAIALKKANRPFVSLNQFTEVPDVSWIDYNTYDVLKSALNKLISLGHSSIAFIGFKMTIKEHADEIYRIYRTTMEEHHIYDENLWSVFETQSNYYSKYKEDYCTQYGRDSIKKMFETSQPTAAFVAGPAIMFGIIEALNAQGISVPDDFSIFTTGNKEEIEPLAHIASTIELPRVERAEKSVEILDLLIRDPEHQPVQEYLSLDSSPPRKRKFRKNKIETLQLV
jgi:DNA-binding LacI/PurR family transcriptional regulator